MARTSYSHIAAADGRPLPIGFRALGLVPRLPRRARGAALRGVLRSKTLVERLPEWEATYPDGRTFVLPAKDRMYASVLCQGVWEPVESAALRRLLREGDFVVDVGANHGWHSIGMGALIGPTGAVWAFEPLPQVVRALRHNVRLNPQLNIEVFPCALGRAPGTLTLHVFGDLPEGHASANALGRSDSEQVDVEKRTLDEVLTTAPRAPALVKIDVEGSDLDVLHGAAELAAREDAPIWLLEVNWEVSRAFGYEPPALLAFLVQQGDYLTYRLTRRGAIPEVQARMAPHASAWLVVPRERLGRMARFPLAR